MARPIAIAMCLCGLAAPGVARAALWNPSVCVRYHPVFDDASSAVGDDHITSSTAVVLGYGIKVVVNQGSTTVFDGYASDSTGCTASFQADDTLSYDVTVYSEALVEGVTIDYRDYTSAAQYSQVWSGVTFSSSAGYLFHFGNNQVSRVMAALSFSLRRVRLEVSGHEIAVWRKDDLSEGLLPGTSSTWCTGTACDIELMVHPTLIDHSRVKNVVAHELGHALLMLRIQTNYPGTSVLTDSTASAWGACPGGAGHLRDSVEYHSEAVNEGFPHFYASRVFNDIATAGCGAYSHYEVDWDHFGGPDGNIYDCDDAPVGLPGLSPGDYQADECATAVPGGPPVFSIETANEYDYQRFFWDLITDESMTPRDIADVIGLANNPTPWNATPVPGSAANPRPRMAAAAATLGFGTDWDNQDDYNGVTR